MQYTLFPVLFFLGVCRSAVLKQNSQNSPGSIDPIVASGLRDVLPSRQRPSHFTVNSQISTIASVKPSFQIDVLLFGKTQVFLQIATDGTVNGTSDCRSEYGKRCSLKQSSRNRFHPNHVSATISYVEHRL